MLTEPINILIAEDDPFQRRIIADMLRSLGQHSIHEVNDGQEAIDVIRHSSDKKIDLVFSDLKMPNMDGMAFLRWLGEEKHTTEVVILSAMDKKLLTAVEKISQLYNVNLLGTLEKPLALAQIKHLLARYGNASPSHIPRAFSPSLSFSLEEILEGIEKKQFKPFLQPKIDLHSGRIIGAEALARWIHPQHGIVAPYAFISKLEQAKQIDSLTFLMLEETTKISHTLMTHGHNLHLAVNLSLVSLNVPNMAHRITQTVTQLGGDPQYFTLEITESTAMTDEPLALENLARLYMDGFTLSVDDYGTGYSNLQQLTRVAFGELKIDRSLVNGFTRNEAMRIIVASNIEMAHKLRIRCVAEGIETEADWEALKKMGCDMGQGFFIAKPMGIGDFTQFLENYRAQPVHRTPSMVHHVIRSAPRTQRAVHESRILLIDDDDFSRNIITQVLRNLGYSQVTDVANAEEAIRLFEIQQFDLIISDIYMPNINGLKLIQRIRTGKTLCKPTTRIMVLSGATDAKALGVAMALNVNGFVVKPIMPNTIDHKIRDILAQPQRALSAIAYETIQTDLEPHD